MKNQLVFGLLLAISLLLWGCASLDNSPPKYIHEAWQKPGKDYIYHQVKTDMQACGYKNTAIANDLTESEIAVAESCMVRNGYILDETSYRANNCYGDNAPYLCKKFWNGAKAKWIPVNASPNN
jgi:hypothetical protein